MTTASIGYGITVQMFDPATPLVLFTLAEVIDITLPKEDDDLIDVTNHDSPNRRREFIVGLTDGGEIDISNNYKQGSLTDSYFRSIRGLTRGAIVTFPDGYKIQMFLVRRGYERDIPVDDKMMSKTTFQVTGDVTETPASAPTNTLAPAVSGLPKVGVVLTAVDGNWSGAGVFTYQWKKDGVNIGGAVAKTYTPIVGDIGTAMSVAVTSTNITGALTVTSTETIDVVA